MKHLPFLAAVAALLLLLLLALCPAATNALVISTCQVVENHKAVSIRVQNFDGCDIVVRNCVDITSLSFETAVSSRSSITIQDTSFNPSSLMAVSFLQEITGDAKIVLRNVTVSTDSTIFSKNYAGLVEFQALVADTQLSIEQSAVDFDFHSGTGTELNLLVALFHGAVRNSSVSVARSAIGLRNLTASNQRLRVGVVDFLNDECSGLHLLNLTDNSLTLRDVHSNKDLEVAIAFFLAKPVVRPGTWIVAHSLLTLDNVSATEYVDVAALRISHGISGGGGASTSLLLDNNSFGGSPEEARQLQSTTDTLTLAAATIDGSCGNFSGGSSIVVTGTRVERMMMRSSDTATVSGGLLFLGNVSNVSTVEVSHVRMSHVHVISESSSASFGVFIIDKIFENITSSVACANNILIDSSLRSNTLSAELKLFTTHDTAIIRHISSLSATGNEISRTLVRNGGGYLARLAVVGIDGPMHFVGDVRIERNRIDDSHVLGDSSAHASFTIFHAGQQLDNIERFGVSSNTIRNGNCSSGGSGGFAKIHLVSLSDNLKQLSLLLLEKNVLSNVSAVSTLKYVEVAVIYCQKIIKLNSPQHGFTIESNSIMVGSITARDEIDIHVLHLSGALYDAGDIAVKNNSVSILDGGVVAGPTSAIKIVQISVFTLSSSSNLNGATTLVVEANSVSNFRELQLPNAATTSSVFVSIFRAAGTVWKLSHMSVISNRISDLAAANINSASASVVVFSSMQLKSVDRFNFSSNTIEHLELQCSMCKTLSAVGIYVGDGAVYNISSSAVPAVFDDNRIAHVAINGTVGAVTRTNAWVNIVRFSGSGFTQSAGGFSSNKSSIINISGSVKLSAAVQGFYIYAATAVLMQRQALTLGALESCGLCSVTGFQLQDVSVFAEVGAAAAGIVYVDGDALYNTSVQVLSAHVERVSVVVGSARGVKAADFSALRIVSSSNGAVLAVDTSTFADVVVASPQVHARFTLLSVGAITLLYDRFSVSKNVLSRIRVSAADQGGESSNLGAFLLGSITGAVQNSRSFLCVENTLSSITVEYVEIGGSASSASSSSIHLLQLGSTLLNTDTLIPLLVNVSGNRGHLLNATHQRHAARMSLLDAQATANMGALHAASLVTVSHNVLSSVVLLSPGRVSSAHQPYCAAVYCAGGVSTFAGGILVERNSIHLAELSPSLQPSVTLRLGIFFIQHIGASKEFDPRDVVSVSCNNYSIAQAASAASSAASKSPVSFLISAFRIDGITNNHGDQWKTLQVAGNSFDFSALSVVDAGNFHVAFFYSPSASNSNNNNNNGLSSSIQVASNSFISPERLSVGAERVVIFTAAWFFSSVAVAHGILNVSSNSFLPGSSGGSSTLESSGGFVTLASLLIGTQAASSAGTLIANDNIIGNFILNATGSVSETGNDAEAAILIVARGSKLFLIAHTLELRRNRVFIPSLTSYAGSALCAVGHVAASLSPSSFGHQSSAAAAAAAAAGIFLEDNELICARIAAVKPPLLSAEFIFDQAVSITNTSTFSSHGFQRHSTFDFVTTNASFFSSNLAQQQMGSSCVPNIGAVWIFGDKLAVSGAGSSRAQLLVVGAVTEDNSSFISGHVVVRGALDSGASSSALSISVSDSELQISTLPETTQMPGWVFGEFGGGGAKNGDVEASPILLYGLAVSGGALSFTLSSTRVHYTPPAGFEPVQQLALYLFLFHSLRPLPTVQLRIVESSAGRSRWTDRTGFVASAVAVGPGVGAECPRPSSITTTAAAATTAAPGPVPPPQQPPPLFGNGSSIEIERVCSSFLTSIFLINATAAGAGGGGNFTAAPATTTVRVARSCSGGSDPQLFGLPRPPPGSLSGSNWTWECNRWGPLQGRKILQQELRGFVDKLRIVPCTATRTRSRSLTEKVSTTTTTTTTTSSSTASTTPSVSTTTNGESTTTGTTTTTTPQLPSSSTAPSSSSTTTSVEATMPTTESPSSSSAAAQQNISSNTSSAQQSSSLLPPTTTTTTPATTLSPTMPQTPHPSTTVTVAPATTPASTQQQQGGGGVVTRTETPTLPLPPAPEHPVIGGATADTIVAATSAFAAASSFAAPTAALQASRALAILYLSSCSMDDTVLPFPIAAFPGWSVWPERGRFYRAALVSNAVVTAALLPLGLAIGYVVCRVSPKSAIGETNLDRALSAGLFPSGVFVASTIFLDGTFSSASTLAAITPNPSVDYPIIIFASLFSLCYAGYMAFRVYRFIFRSNSIRFAPSFVRATKERGCGESYAKSAAARFFMFGSTAWLPSSIGINAEMPPEAKKLRFLFWQMRHRRPNESRIAVCAPLFFFFDLVLTIIVSVARGIRFNCEPILWLVMAISLISCGAVIWLQPSRVPFKNLLCCVSSALTAAGACLVVLGRQRHDDSLREWGELLSVASALSVCLGLPVSVLRILLSRWLGLTFEPVADMREDNELEDLAAELAAVDLGGGSRAAAGTGGRRDDDEDDDDIAAYLSEDVVSPGGVGSGDRRAAVPVMEDEDLEQLMAQCEIENRKAEEDLLDI